MIDFALSKTGQKDLHYIGHSQGTTSFFVMASLRKEMNAKIRTMHAFGKSKANILKLLESKWILYSPSHYNFSRCTAPVAFMSNLKSPFLRAIAPFVDSVETVMKMLGVYEFLPSNDMMINGGKLVCKDESPIQELCANVFFLMFGYNSAQLNRTLLPEILANNPAGKAFVIGKKEQILSLKAFQVLLLTSSFITGKESIQENSECLTTE
jgi:lysosomal acid lipase/cholesteryl ester hydrolase